MRGTQKREVWDTGEIVRRRWVGRGFLESLRKRKEAGAERCALCAGAV